MLQFLRAEHAAGPDDLFVFMGDYIDRGSKSRDVIELMLEVRRDWPKTVFLKGNHEDMLLETFDAEIAAAQNPMFDRLLGRWGQKRSRQS